MDENEIVKYLNESFEMTREESHISSDFKTIEDFKIEYGEMEVNDMIDEFKERL